MSPNENADPTPTDKPQAGPTEGAEAAEGADGASSADVLRSMEEDSDRLAEEIDEARVAVQAAHRADSMAMPGEEDFGGFDDAPVHGGGPVDPDAGRNESGTSESSGS